MGGDKSRSGTGRIDKPCGAHIQARALGRTQRTVDDVARAVRRLLGYRSIEGVSP